MDVRHALALFLLAGTACTEARKLDGGASGKCTRCHGQGEDPSPPPALNGDTKTTSLGVGAHQTHVRGGPLRPPLACSECHIMPSPENGSEHPSTKGGPAPVVFANLAHNDSANPQWDRQSATCSDVFCHGSTLRWGQDRPWPVWTRVDGSQIKCTSCHGYPPALTHPQDDRCETCHSVVMAPGGVIKAPELHVNGKLELDHTF